MSTQIHALDVHLTPDWAERALANDVRQAFTQRPRILSPKWFYDTRGSELFDQITRLPEYYPTEAERTILKLYSSEIVSLSKADTLVELGSGSSDKTRTLMDAFDAQGSLKRFIPFDVSEAPLREAIGSLSQRYPKLGFHGVVGDFTQHLGLIPQGGKRLLAFLGGTLGNLYPAERQAFLEDLHGALRPGDTLLLGTDLVKAEDRLWKAYNDSLGVTAEFNLNVLQVINRELNANFELSQWQHVAEWDAENERMDLRLRSKHLQRVDIGALGLRCVFEQGEDICTEISTKFRPQGIREELHQAGFEVQHLWTDPQEDFGLSLSTRI